MVRREFIRTQLYKILDSIKDVETIKVWKPNLNKKAVSFVDLGDDFNVLRLENSYTLNSFETQFVTVIQYKITKDLIDSGKLVNVADNYLESLQLAFNKVDIETTFETADYVMNIEFIHIDSIESMVSDNMEIGIVSINGKIKNSQRWF